MKHNRILHGFLCLLLVGGLSACSSNKKKELDPVKLESFTKEINVDTLWSRKIGSGLGDFYNQFVVAVDDAYVYAASEDGKIYKFDKLTGKKQWKVSIDNTLTSGVTVDEKQLYVGALDGSLIAIDKKDGKQVWIKSLTSEVVSSGSVYMGHLIVQAANGEVYDLDTLSGEQRWRFDSPMPALTLRGNSRARFFANYAVIGMANGKLAVIDITTGQVVWEPKIADAKGDTEIERIVDVDAAPLVLLDKLVAVSMQGRLTAHDLKTGRLLWSEEESSFRDIDASQDKVFVSNVDGVVTAYDQQNGTIKWVNEDFLRRKVSAPRVVGSFVVVGDFEGYVHVLSQTDGHVVARKRAAWTGVRSPAVVDENRFYIIANNGRLKAYELGEAIK